MLIDAYVVTRMGSITLHRLVGDPLLDGPHTALYMPWYVGAGVGVGS